MTAPLLQVDRLDIDYRVGGRSQRAVHGVTLDLAAGEVLGLIGESGSGKSTLAMALLGGLPPGGSVTGGRIRFDGRDLVGAGPRDWRTLRWTRLAYVPQAALNALNPVRRIEAQFADIFRDHGVTRERRVVRERAGKVLAEVNLDAAVLHCFPHELSGGMRQRVCIAMAMLLDPALIIADEPTSALDVVSQRLVMDALARVRRRTGCSIVLVGHDLALQSEIADRIAILFAGRLVEIGPAAAIFDRPAHPYTRRLLAAIPILDAEAGLPAIERADEADRLAWSAPGRWAAVGADHFAAVGEMP